MNPLVTIGCAVYNGEATLARALTPLVEQDYENIEILISDDGSTDGSKDIYESFARKDPRIKILKNDKNIGISENYNRLLKEASGKYFVWADQDDIRDRTFVRKAVATLEANSEAVLCHSHTGVFVGDENFIHYVVTLHGVDAVCNRVLRYFKFLQYFSDTCIYGLIRTDALRSTHAWTHDLGAANALLFELLLRGTFIQIPEVLYYYSARGIRNRPDAKAEYKRLNPDREMPFLYFPFLILARNQARDIFHSTASPYEKVCLNACLWGHTVAVATTKLIYRSLTGTLGDVPSRFTEICNQIVDPSTHVVFPDGAERDESLFPKLWTLKGGL